MFSSFCTSKLGLDGGQFHANLCHHWGEFVSMFDGCILVEGKLFQHAQPCLFVCFGKSYAFNISGGGAFCIIHHLFYFLVEIGEGCNARMWRGPYEGGLSILSS